MLFGTVLEFPITPKHEPQKQASRHHCIREKGQTAPGQYCPDKERVQGLEFREVWYLLWQKQSCQITYRLYACMYIYFMCENLLLFSHLSHGRFFCDPTDCSPPGSSVHGISQVRILEWV